MFLKYSYLLLILVEAILGQNQQFISSTLYRFEKVPKSSIVAPVAVTYNDNIPISELHRIVYQYYPPTGIKKGFYEPIKFIKYIAREDVPRKLDVKELRFLLWEFSHHPSVDDIVFFMNKNPLFTDLIINSEIAAIDNIMPQILQSAAFSNIKNFATILFHPRVFYSTNPHKMPIMKFSDYAISIARIFEISNGENEKIENIIIIGLKRIWPAIIISLINQKYDIDRITPLIMNDSIMEQLTEKNIESIVNALLTLGNSANYIISAIASKEKNKSRLSGEAWGKIILGLLKDASSITPPSIDFLDDDFEFGWECALLLENAKIISSIPQNLFAAIVRELLSLPMTHLYVFSYLLTPHFLNRLSGADIADILDGLLIKGNYQIFKFLAASPLLLGKIPDDRLNQVIQEYMLHLEKSKSVGHFLSASTTLNRLQELDWPKYAKALIETQNGDAVVAKLMKSPSIMKKFNNQQFKEMFNAILEMKHGFQHIIATMLRSEPTVSRMDKNQIAALLKFLLSHGELADATFMLTNDAIMKQISKSQINHSLRIAIKSFDPSWTLNYYFKNFIDALRKLSSRIDDDVWGSLLIKLVQNNVKDSIFLIKDEGIMSKISGRQKLILYSLLASKSDFHIYVGVNNIIQELINMKGEKYTDHIKKIFGLIPEKQIIHDKDYKYDYYQLNGQNVPVLVPISKDTKNEETFKMILREHSYITKNGALKKQYNPVRIITAGKSTMPKNPNAGRMFKNGLGII